ncbi:MAG: DUF4097 family beta strand repeat protein, partial [Calditrichia bacterium]|nr:DUF4097 family beta strand repeat protein [Calditrichia bacterium]
MKTLKIFRVILFALMPLFIFAQKDVNESRDVNKDVKLDISNVSGSVDIIGWNKSEVKIEGSLEEDVKELEIEGNKSRLKIKVRIPRYGNNRHASAYLTIYVPRQSLLDVGTVSAGITIKNINSKEMEVGSVSGSLEVNASCEEMQLETVSGKIELEGKGRDVEVSSVSGSLKINGEFKKIESGTVSGRIRVNADNIKDGEFGTTSGSIEFDGGIKGSGRFKFKSVSGSIELRLPGNISADFD